jgi:hypothetical protein
MTLVAWVVTTNWILGNIGGVIEHAHGDAVVLVLKHELVGVKVDADSV